MLFNQNHMSLVSTMTDLTIIYQNNNLILLVLRVMILNFMQCLAKNLINTILVNAWTLVSLKLTMKFKSTTLTQIHLITWHKEKEVESFTIKKKLETRN